MVTTRKAASDPSLDQRPASAGDEDTNMAAEDVIHVAKPETSPAKSDGKPETSSSDEKKDVKREKKRVRPVKVAAKRKTKWDAPGVLQNEKSPLASLDIRELIQHPRAWECLTAEQKQHILSLFPTQDAILDAGTPDARPNVPALLNNDNFRHDESKYRDNLALGKHNPGWLFQGQSAHEQRCAGLFKEFLDRKVEEDWGCVLNPGARDQSSPPGASTANSASNGAQSPTNVPMDGVQPAPKIGGTA